MIFKCGFQNVSEYLVELVERLKMNRHIKYVYFGQNKMSDEDVKVLCELIRENKEISHLAVCSSQLSDNSVRMIIEALE